MKMGRIMSLSFASALLISLAVPMVAREQETPAPKATSKGKAPLKLVGKFEFPSDVKGNFDQVITDHKTHRLFTATEHHHTVDVFDLRSGKLIHSIGGIDLPHCMYYREDLHRLYVSDGEAGDLKIFDGETYKLIKSVKLLVDADAVGYDPATKYLYVVNGGKDAKMAYTTLSVIDTTAGEKVADIKVDGSTLEAMVFESASSKMYINNRANNRVDVIDRETRTVVSSWPITLCKTNVAMAFDEAHHRLFVGCRSGHIVIFDTETGKELQALPINTGIDDMIFDAASKRIYAPAPAGAGTIDVYEETGPDTYKSLGQIPGGPGGRSGSLVPELHRYFLAVPQHESTNSQILVYQVQ